MSEDNLDENTLDKVISVSKAVLGDLGVPSIIVEIFGNLIPNQRLDRITKFIRELEKRISDLEIIITDIDKQTEYIHLLENGMLHAYRASSDKRLEYIASIISNGLTEEKIEVNRYIYLLNILDELNDEEIIWLRFYLHPTIGGDEEFRDKHQETLRLARAYIGAEQEELDKSALQDSYKEHLERLGLIKTKINIDRNTKMPIYDSFGNPKGYKYISHLGKMLLREIGLI
ncbi:hypothetical protein [Pasteurella multocida]|uniref:hypothetical protein n=1 Tax=Pasteurella multocida TaxID=747 RepID=UPI00147CF755|nr:hypothetical protein [Pasteurella multocida]NNI31481.1 hypothetical protein [Pasteurella multocida]NNI61820.1 hypothetical protein [Pasteurella multocida]NNI76599.1 hypothetical protein [Pasteurella multocida]